MSGGNLPVPVFEPATISAVAAGAATDGRALVSVLWRGSVLEVPYLPPAAAYTSADVGRAVVLLVQGTQVVLLGPLHGTPSDL